MTTESKSAGERFEPLAAPAYFLAALLVITPLGDFASGVWPWRPSALDWRFASVGLLSGFLLTPLLGALIAVGVAAALGSQRTLRALGIATLAGGAVCALILVPFVLDAVQLNRSIPQQQHRAFLDASIKALVKYIMFCAAAYLLGIRAYRLGNRKAARRAPAPRETIVIGAGATTGESAAT